jgi:hypothetical protein
VPLLLVGHIVIRSERRSSTIRKRCSSENTTSVTEEIDVGDVLVEFVGIALP